MDEHGMSSCAFSSLTDRKGKPILPAIKMQNRAALQDLLMSEEEVNQYNRTIDAVGPTPGVIPLAAARRKLIPAFSFNRVQMKSTLLNSISKPLSKFD